MKILIIITNAFAFLLLSITAENVMMLMGATGTGKSTFGNYFMKILNNHEQSTGFFQTSDSPQSCTSEFQMFSDGNILVTDTPGLLDTNEANSDDEYIIDVVNHSRDLDPVNEFILFLVWNETTSLPSFFTAATLLAIS